MKESEAVQAPGISDLEEYPVGSEGWADLVRLKVKTFNRQLDTGYMKLGEMLYLVWNTPVNGDPDNPPIYTLWGYEHFHEYASHELSINRRKAEQLRKIYYVLHKALDLSEAEKERATKLGFSKMRALASVLDEDNFDEWMTRAEGCSYAELEAILKLYRDNKREAAAEGKDPEEVEIPEAEDANYERFMFFPEQHAIVQEALKVAASISESESKSHNMTLICMDYLATNGAAPPGTAAFRNYLDSQESIFGVKFIAVDHKATPPDLLYGLEALESLAAAHGAELAEEEEVSGAE